jgi:hypothetical protein
MSIGNLPVGSYKQITASASCTTSEGALVGIFVSAASVTPTITVYDAGGSNPFSTAIKIVDTFTPVAGTYYTLPFGTTLGVYVVISGTVSCTVSAV